MSKLGAVLEKLFQPGPHFESLHARIEDHVILLPGVEPTEEMMSSVAEVWAAYPGRYRVEELRKRGEKETQQTVIVLGKKKWEIDNEGFATCEESDRMDPPMPFDRHFDLFHIRRYLTNLDLEYAGEGAVAGRAAVQAKGVVSTNRRSGLWPHWLPYNADYYLISFDELTGLVLAIEGHYGDGRIHHQAVTHLEIDQPIDPKLLTEPDIPEEKREAPDKMVWLTPETARATIPYRFFLPTYPPGIEKEPVEIIWRAPSRRSKRPHLDIHYRNARYTEGFWMHQLPEIHVAGEKLPENHDVRSVDNREIILFRDERTVNARLTIDGIAIGIHSLNLNEDELVKIAASLIPAK